MWTRTSRTMTRVSLVTRWRSESAGERLPTALPGWTGLIGPNKPPGSRVGIRQHGTDVGFSSASVLVAVAASGPGF